METTATANLQTDASSADAAAMPAVDASASSAAASTQQPVTDPTPAAAATDATVESQGTAAPAAPVAPENYSFSAPEGVTYAPDVIETFSGAAKAAGLTQDAAQKVLDAMAPALAARQAEQIKSIHTEWMTASSSDKEFGGERLAENLAVARKALDTFGTPELRKLLDNTGLGNHPEQIRMLYRIGKAISEDTFVGGRSAAAPKPASAASILYDKTPQKG